MTAQIRPFVLLLPLMTAVMTAASARAAVDPSRLLPATRDSLALSMTDRLEALRAQGPQGYRNLVSIMFDEGAAMGQRWKATTAVGRLGGKLSLPELERAYKRKEWFMRSAALLAMGGVDQQKHLSWARALLSDRALVVRAAAVDAIDAARDAGSAGALWSRLNAKENFNGGDSLWIRRRMAEALSRLAGPGSEPRFYKLLADRDESLHGPALDALERLSKHRLGAPNASVAMRRELWLERSRNPRIF